MISARHSLAHKTGEQRKQPTSLSPVTGTVFRSTIVPVYGRHHLTVSGARLCVVCQRTICLLERVSSMCVCDDGTSIITRLCVYVSLPCIKPIPGDWQAPTSFATGIASGSYAKVITHKCTVILLVVSFPSRDNGTESFLTFIGGLPMDSPKQSVL